MYVGAWGLPRSEVAVLEGNMGKLRIGFLCLVLLGGFYYSHSLRASQNEGFLRNFTAVNLVDQNGDVFTPSSLQGRVVLFNFIFTGCDSSCPLQTRILAQVMQALPDQARDQVRFVSISVDPGNDTPEKMRKFSQEMQADLKGWLFLSGDVLQTQALARRLHLLDEKNSTGPHIHRTSLWLMDKQGRMLQRYHGNPPDKDRLIRELVQVTQLPVATQSESQF